MRLILHAGTHKTGTTSIQHFAYENREAFRIRGLIYPEGGTGKIWRSHNWIAHHLTESHPGPSDPVRALLERLRDNAKEGDIIFLSSEDVSACCIGRRLWQGLERNDFRERQLAYLGRLSQLLEDFDVEVILVFRRADEFAQSLYQTLIRSNKYGNSFEAFLEYSSPLFNYKAQADAFKIFFSTVNLISYHSIESNLIASFFNMLGYPIMQETGTSRKVSTDARLTYWLATRITRQQLSSEELLLVKEFISSEAARELFPDFRRSTFWLTNESRRRFHDQAVEGFKSDFFPAFVPKSESNARLEATELDRVTQQFERWKNRRRKGRSASVHKISRWLYPRPGLWGR